MKKLILLAILFCLVSSSALASDFDQASIMYEAIKRGDAQKVNQLLDFGFDPNQIVAVRETGLMLAADNGQAQIVKIFINRGADVNEKAYDVIFDTISTPAIHAVKNAEIMKLLIIAGADVNFQFKNETVLAKALDQGTPDVVKILISSGAKLSSIYEAAMLGDTKYINEYGNSETINKRFGKDGNTPLLGCVKTGNAEIVELLLKKGADPNLTNAAGETPILIAVKLEDVSIVKLLTQYGTDLSYKPRYLTFQSVLDKPLILAARKPNIFKVLIGSGAKPSDLIEAAAIGDTESIKQLIQSGADVNAGDLVTPLMAAAAEGNVEAIKTLLSSSADIEKTNRNGITSLMIAAAKGNLDAVKELIFAGAKLDGALAAAASNGHIETVTELVKSGADISNSGDALSNAAFCGRLSMVKYLIQLGAKPNRDTLYRAVLDKHYDIIEYLLSLGMDINEKDRNGATYLESAVIAGDEKMIKLLLSHGADINSRDANGVTVLGHAGLCHKYFLFDLLQSYGATI